VDLQAQARVWRDGQTKPCVLYRLLSTGTMEEKVGFLLLILFIYQFPQQVFQRQISKRELHSTLVEDAGHDIRNFSPNKLRRLFIPPSSPPSPPHTNYRCSNARSPSANSTPLSSKTPATTSAISPPTSSADFLSSLLPTSAVRPMTCYAKEEVEGEGEGGREEEEEGRRIGGRIIGGQRIFVTCV